MAQDAMQLLNMLSAPGQISGTQVSLDAPDMDLRAWLRNEGYTDTDNENKQFSRDEMLDSMLPILGPSGTAMFPQGKTYQPGTHSADYDPIYQSGYNVNGRTYLSPEQLNQIQSISSANESFMSKFAPLIMGGIVGGGMALGGMGASALGGSELLGGASGGFDMLGSGSSLMDAFGFTGGGATGTLGGIANGSSLWDIGVGETGAFDMMGSAGTGLPGSVAPTAGGSSWLDQLKRLISPNMPGGGRGGNNNNNPGLLSSLASLIGGGMGLGQAGKLGALAGPGNAAAQRLQMLMANPGAIKDTPGYQELLKSRGDALSRRLAAQGYNLSGNEKASLAELGGAQYAEFYGNEMDRLSKMTQGAVAPSIAESQQRANAINRLIYGGMGVGNAVFGG